MIGVGKKVIIIWTSSLERECYGTPIGVVKSYNKDNGLYLVETDEGDGCITTGYYSEDEISQSLLLRLVSKAQQNKIERILNLNQTKIMYYTIGMCIGMFSLYYWLC